jgi:hypothetical protein
VLIVDGCTGVDRLDLLSSRPIFGIVYATMPRQVVGVAYVTPPPTVTWRDFAYFVASTVPGATPMTMSTA